MKKLIGSLIISLIILLGSCSHSNTVNDKLFLFSDSVRDAYGYLNQKGDTIIPAGKYVICYTDTFKNYAIVAHPIKGFVGIDKQENILFNVYSFDNGPDYPSDGLFRIIKNDKIGFTNFSTGLIIIEPQYVCAFPFENGMAKVSNHCAVASNDEHNTWVSSEWFFIDKKGNKVEPTH